MTVNRPLNIHDVDIGPSEIPAEAAATEPTDTSRFLERLRLAEISRSIVDHTLQSSTNFISPSCDTQITAMDLEIAQMITTIPPFFQLASYEYVSDTSEASSIFIQAYLLNWLMQTQRYKLHITYLTSGSKEI